MAAAAVDTPNAEAVTGDVAVHLREKQRAFAKSMKKTGTGRRNRVTSPGGNGTAEATARASEQNLSGDDAAFRRLLRRQRGGALERFLVEIEKGKKEECCAWWIFPTRDRG